MRATPIPAAARSRWTTGAWRLLVLGVLLCGLSGCNVITFNRQLTLRSYARLQIRPQERELSSGHLRYYAGGQGFPVLLIHGFGFTALENWENQVGALIGPYRVLAPDLYWFGGSTPRPGAKVETAAEQADALSELLERLGVGKTHVVGVSFGGYVALELALRHPDKLGKLVLVDAAGLELTTAEADQVSAVFGGERDISAVLLPRDVIALRKFLGTVFYQPRWIPTFALRQVLREFWLNERARRAILRGLQSGGLLQPAVVQGVGAETLVLWGRHDPLIPPSVGERLTRLIPGARIRYLERSAHSPMLEEPAEFNRALLDFLYAPPRARPAPPPTRAPRS